MEITINPSSKRAARAVSAKVLMPLLDNKGLVLARKFLRVRELPDLQANRLAQLDHGIDLEHRFTLP